MSVLGIHTWVTAESANKQQMICNFCSIATLSNPIALNERLKIKESENKDISYIARELFADFASYRALSTQKKHPYLYSKQGVTLASYPDSCLGMRLELLLKNA